MSVSAYTCGAWNKVRHALFRGTKELEEKTQKVVHQVEHNKRLVNIAKQIEPNANRPDVLRRLAHAMHEVNR